MLQSLVTKETARQAGEGTGAVDGLRLHMRSKVANRALAGRCQKAGPVRPPRTSKDEAPKHLQRKAGLATTRTNAASWPSREDHRPRRTREVRPWAEETSLSQPRIPAPAFCACATLWRTRAWSTEVPSPSALRV